jgi:hypothetical protein
MKHNIVKIENYLLVAEEIADESVLKQGDSILHCSNELGVVMSTYPDSKHSHKIVAMFPNSGIVFCADYNCKKVISHLPIGQSPMLDGVDVLPAIDDVGMPVAFECEMEKSSDSFGSWFGKVIRPKSRKKTTTNPLGQTVWVGKYIY